MRLVINLVFHLNTLLCIFYSISRCFSYLLLVIKGKKIAQANIGVKLGGKPINLDTIKQRTKRQDDLSVSTI